MSALSTESSPAFHELDSIADFLSIWLNNKLLGSESQAFLENYYSKWARLDSPRLRHWYVDQSRELRAILTTHSAPRMLEVGVGSGTESLWFALQGVDVTGIDAFEYVASVAKERLGVLETSVGRKLECHLEACPLLEFDDQDGFDVIWLEQAFHHLEPREAVVEKIASLLRPGGSVVFSEANAWNPLLQLQLLATRGTKLVMEIETEGKRVLYGNERILTADALASLLSNVGLTEDSRRYFRLFPAGPAFNPFLAIEKYAARNPLSRLCRPLFTHYNLVATRLPTKSFV